jgi:regulator of RNase E activity RraA
MRKRNPKKLKTVDAAPVEAVAGHVVTLDVFGGDKMIKMQNDFMHASDVFERGKQLVKYFQMEIRGDPDMQKLCENAKNAFEKGTEGYVVFIAIRDVDGVRCDNPRAVFKEGVQTLSMERDSGLKWGLFKDILGQLGYKTETNEFMMVQSVSI